MSSNNKTIINEKNVDEVTKIGAQTQALLTLMTAGEAPDFDDFLAEQARTIFHPVFKSLSKTSTFQVTIKKLNITPDIPCIELTPESDKPKNDWPTIIFIHGGGWALADFDCYINFVKSVCHYCQAKVFFLEYDLSPEKKFPFALNQAHSLLQYLHDNNQQLEIDAERIGILGDSSGGNMALALGLLNRDNSTSYQIKVMCLCYPLLDLTINSTRASRIKFGQGDYFTSEGILNWSVQNYINESEDTLNPLASPLLARSFKQLPPTIIISAGFDPLQDENNELQQRLNQNNVTNELLHFPSTIHGFLSYSASLDIAEVGLKEICQRIRNRL
ncbi:MAG: alpha/beta hydrolase [Colwellia sp.]|nr:alpha/beta hydrolase [Colwellia sp.]